MPNPPIPHHLFVDSRQRRRPIQFNRVHRFETTAVLYPGRYGFLRSAASPEVMASLPPWDLEDTIVGPFRTTHHTPDQPVARDQRIVDTASNHLSVTSTPASNPNPQDVALTSSMIPEDEDDGPLFQAPLRHLRDLRLVGELRRVFRLLDRLSFPGTLDSLSLTALDSVIKDV